MKFFSVSKNKLFLAGLACILFLMPICLSAMQSSMRMLHTMIRVADLDRSIAFYCDILGMQVLRQNDYPSGKFTLTFVGYGSEDSHTVIELTYNWDQHEYQHGNAFGHIAIATNDIEQTVQKMKEQGVTVTREPGPMKFGGGAIIAFVKDPDGYIIELIEKN